MNERSTGEYSSRTGSVQGRVEYSRRETEPPSIAVVRALARFADDDPIDVEPPLNDVLDADALDALFADRPDGTSRGMGTVSFDVADARVVVSADGVEVSHGGDDH